MPTISIYYKLKSGMSRALFTITLLSLFLAPTNLILAQTFNKQINYQGKLTNSSGVAVTDGDYNLEFKIYTAASGGSALWTESRTGASRVTVTNGMFSVMLGEVTPITSIDWNQALYLGVNVGGSGLVAIWDGEMTPRKILGSVPSAFQSDKLDDLDSTQFLRADATSTLAVSSTDTALIINQTGAGDLLNLKTSGVSQFSVSNAGLTTVKNLTVTSGITLGGEYRSTWPSGGGTAGYWATSSNSLVGYPSLSGDYAIVIGGSATTTDNLKFEVVGNAKIGGSLVSIGNLGVGTSSPFTKLSVAGDSYLGGNVVATGTLSVDGLSALSNLIATNATVTNATSTSFYAQIFTALNSSVTNFFATNSTTTNATTTNLAVSGSFSVGNLGGVLFGDNGVISATSTLSPLYGGTGASSFSTNALTYFDGTKLNSTSSPTVAYITATSTSATSTFAGGLMIGNNGLVFDHSLGTVGIGTAPSATAQLFVASSTGTGNNPVVKFTSSANRPTLQVQSRDGLPSTYVIFDVNGDNASDEAFGSSLNSEAFNRFAFDVSGVLSWGTGSGARDTNLYRSAVDTLKTDDSLLIVGNLGIGTTSPYAPLSVNGQAVALYYTATSTSIASTFPYASTTALTVSGSTYLGSLTGPLQAVNGLVSATSTLSTAYGGTGLSSSLVVGDLLYANTTSSFARLAAVASGYALLSGGTGTSPSYGKVGLTTHVSGTLPVSNGGTGQTSFGQGWLSSNGTAITSSTSPTVNYVTATSTTVASTFPYASTTALTVSGTSYLLGNVNIGAGVTPKLLTVNGKSLFNVGEDTDEFVIFSNPNGSNVFRYNGSDNNLLLQEVGGKVGIGTTTTMGLLTVQDPNDINGYSSLFLPGGQSYKHVMAGALSNNYEIFSLEWASDVFNIDTDSGLISLAQPTAFKVGIGTIAPASKLEVNGGGTGATTTIRIDTGGADNDGSLEFWDDTTLQLKLFSERLWNPRDGIRSYSSDRFVIEGQNGGEIATFNTDGTGGVGIASSSPSAYLSISPATMTSGVNAPLTIAAYGANGFTTPNFGDPGTNGGGFLFQSGAGGGSQVGAAGSGGALIISTGAGGVATAGGSGGYGGDISLTAGAGGTGVGGGLGGTITMNAGRNGANTVTSSIYLSTNGGNVLLATNNGSVGIGTTNPQYKLDIQGSAPHLNLDSSQSAYAIVDRGDSTTYEAGYILRTAGTNVGFFAIDAGSDNLRILRGSSISGAGGITLDASNNVGIGTTTPGAKFHVNAGNADFLAAPIEATRLEITSSAAGNLEAGSGPALTFYVPETGSGSQLGAQIAAVREFGIDSIASTSLAFWTAGDDASPTEKMRITSAGNVGIGITSPATVLHISSSGTAVGALDTATKFLVDNTGSGVVAQFNGATAANEETLIGFSYRQGASVPPAQLGYVIDSDGWTGVSKGALVFKTRAVTTATTPTERLRITSGGNVGIGTTTPSSKLDVYYAPTASTATFVSGSADLNLIGTTGAAIGKGFYAQAYSGDDADASIYGVHGKTNTGKYAYGVYGEAVNGDTEYGVYGIATGNAGTSLATGIYGTASGGSTNWAGYFDGGNVYVANNLGIGDTTPTFKLDVNGTVAFQALTTAAGSPSTICMNAATKEITVNAAATCTVSDEEQKTPLESLAFSALDLIGQLNPSSYEYKAEPGRLRYGFGAQSLQGVDPRLADAYDQLGVARSVDLHALMALNTKGIQELDKKVDDLSKDLVWIVDLDTAQIKPLASLNLNDFDIENIRSLRSASGNWSLTEDGLLAVKKLQADSICLEDLCINKQTLKSVLDQLGLTSATVETPPAIEDPVDTDSPDSDPVQGDSPPESDTPVLDNEDPTATNPPVTESPVSEPPAPMAEQPAEEEELISPAVEESVIPSAPDEPGISTLPVSEETSSEGL